MLRREVNCLRLIDKERKSHGESLKVCYPLLGDNMNIEKNVDLSKFTTVKVGEIAREFVTPESVEELTEVIRDRKPKYKIAGGSNLLINDEKEFEGLSS